MPIRAFFKLYEEGVSLQAAEYREALNIAIAPNRNHSYYEFLQSRYNRVISKTAPKLPEKPVDEFLNADSEEAKGAILGLFWNMKRGMGYGR